MFISTWVILVAGLLLSLPAVYWRVKDQTDIVLVFNTSMSSSDEMKPESLTG